MPIARALLIAALSCGCYSALALGRARIVDKGRFELVAASGVTAVATAHGDPNPRPSLELGVRYGLTDRVERGGRISDSGGVASVRTQLRRGDTYGIDFLLAPGLAYTATDKLAAELPVLIGWNLPRHNQLVLAPRLVYQLRFGVGDQAQPAAFVFAGGSLAFVWQVTSRVSLAPQAGVLFVVYAAPGFTSFTTPGPAVQAAIAVLLNP